MIVARTRAIRRHSRIRRKKDFCFLEEWYTVFFNSRTRSTTHMTCVLSAIGVFFVGACRSMLSEEGGGDGDDGECYKVKYSAEGQ